MLCSCIDFPACNHRLTLGEFVEKHTVTCTVEHVTENPHMPGSEMDHWKCVLTAFRRGSSRPHRWTSYFSKGPGHHGAPPTAEEVLNCAALDSTGIENAGDFEEWCREYGYDTDSRRAERAYELCRSAAGKLKKFLGDEAYDVLLFHTEGL